MEDLYSIKKKLENYKKIKQMTDATKLASITNYFLGSKKIAFITNYLDYFYTLGQIIFEKLSATKNQSDDWFSESELKRINQKKSLIIIIGATRELGAGVFQVVKKKLDTFLSKETLECDFIFIGKGSSRIFKSFNLHNKIVLHVSDFGFNQAKNVCQKITTYLYNRLDTYKNIFIINAQFRNFFIQKPNKKTLYPFFQHENFLLYLEKEQNNVNNNPIESIWEQSHQVIFKQFSLKFIEEQIFFEIISSLNAEYASRFSAMEKSSSNAEKSIHEMTLKMNRLRQFIITRQITELFASLTEDY